MKVSILFSLCALLLAQSAQAACSQNDWRKLLSQSDASAIRAYVSKNLCDLNAELEGDSKVPLVYAIEAHKLDAVKTLLQLGADPNADGYDGQTPLFNATDVKDMSIVQALVEQGADVNASTRFSNRTVLINAIQGSTPAIVAYLVAHKASLSETDKYGHKPAFYVGTLPANQRAAMQAALVKPPAEAINRAEDAIVALPGNTLSVHTNQTLVGSTPDQYSVKNLFDANPAKAWVFHGEEQYPKARQIKNPAVLTLTLAHPSPLFAIMLTPGYNKSAAIQFQNASPELVDVRLYRPNDDKPFEHKLFHLHYHASGYLQAELQKALKTVAFETTKDGFAIGKSENPINTAERMLLINHGGAPIAKIELEISSMERGAKFSDVALGKLRLLDNQNHQNTPEYKLAQFIYHDVDQAVPAIADVPRCLAYTAQNPFPRLKEQDCTAHAPKALGDAKADFIDAMQTYQDPATHEYQIPFALTLRDGVDATINGKTRFRVSGSGVANNELIMGKTATGQLKALSGGSLNQFFLATPKGDVDMAYLQPQDNPHFFFGFVRLQFTPENDRYRISVYGPDGNPERKWVGE